jgi:tripartite-type tricarboxylate transporter receptor subunit TctC
MRRIVMNRRDFSLSLASLSAALPSFAFAQAKFPERPIKLVVPFSAGGVNDIVGRQWAEKMRGPLGSVFVENQGGAGGTLGVMEVKRADADGHTLLLGSGSTMMMNELTTSNLPYDTSKDFIPIAIFCVSTTSIAVNASVPVKNVKELVDYHKANPGKLSYGSAGTGTMSHLSGELFKLKTGLKDVVHIPYKGAGPGIADLVSGHIPMMSPNISGQILSLHNSGKIRVLAVNSKTRLKAAPDIPTAIEQGVPDMVGELFLGIYARTGTPSHVLDRIADATKKVMADEAFEKALLVAGFEPVSHFGAEQGRRYMAEEVARWKPVVDAIGLKVR